MIRLKPGVRIHGLKPEALFLAQVAEGVYGKHGFETIITSGMDGTHSAGSKHYVGFALDFRINHLPNREMAISIKDEIADAVGHDYDVILEGDHIHGEFQPKDSY